MSERRSGSPPAEAAGDGGGFTLRFAGRIALWVGTAAVGAYLILTGVFGILAKG